MKRLSTFLLFVLLASFLASCIVHTHPRRRCRTDCWWEHGRRVCAERCR